MQTHLQPFDFFQSIYYINLDSRKDRNEQAMSEFVKMGIADKVQRVSGTIHENPATGCHLSHATCLADAMLNGVENILIFEDDVEFFENASENLMLSLSDLPLEWDMLYLGANLDRYPAYRHSEHLVKITGAYATHAYAINKTMFEKLYEINVAEDTIHNDVTYAETIHPNYQCFLTYPLVAGQRDSYSDIQRTMMSSNQMFKERVEKNIVKWTE